MDCLTIIYLYYWFFFFFHLLDLDLALKIFIYIVLIELIDFQDILIMFERRIHSLKIVSFIMNNFISFNKNRKNYWHSEVILPLLL